MKPKNMPRPISVKAVGKPIMITITMSVSIKSPSAGSLMCSSPRPCRAGARSRRSLCAPSIAILRDSSSTYSLCASCSSMTSISATSFSRLGHSPVLQADDAAHDLGDALQHHERAGDRNDGLEMIDRRAVRRDVGMLVDAPGDRRRSRNPRRSARRCRAGRRRYTGR